MAADTPRRALGEGLEQTGFRVTAQTRQELVMAQAFLGHRSLQAVLDAAIEQFLGDLREDAPGFDAALTSAARFRRRARRVATDPLDTTDPTTNGTTRAREDHQ